jgi:hypothetical protein
MHVHIDGDSLHAMYALHRLFDGMLLRIARQCAGQRDHAILDDHADVSGLDDRIPAEFELASR